MDGDDDSSSDPPPRRKDVIILFLTAYLGYTITDTYFILWLSGIFGESSVSVANSIGAVIAVFFGIGILKFLRGVESVNKKVFIGSFIYVILELLLYIILYGEHVYLLLVIVFVLDNLALITYSAPIETLAIKLMGKEKNIEVGTLSTRMYIVAGVIGAAIAYAFYPCYQCILLSSVIFKVTTAVMALKMPYAENHDSIDFDDVFDPDLLKTLPMATASEVFYLTAPVIVSSMIGEKQYAVYVIIMQIVVFITLPRLAGSKKLSKYAVITSLIIPFVPLLALLPYYSFMNAIVLRVRDDIIDEWGVDDTVTGVNLQKVFAAVLAVPFIKVFGTSVWVLAGFMLLSAGVLEISKRKSTITLQVQGLFQESR